MKRARPEAGPSHLAGVGGELRLSDLSRGGPPRQPQVVSLPPSRGWRWTGPPREGSQEEAGAEAQTEKGEIVGQNVPGAKGLVDWSTFIRNR